MNELQAGQKLWFVPSQRYLGASREVEVTKVGRIWAQLSNGHRIDKTSLVADGGGYMSPGKCYPSETEYNKKVELTAAWNALAATMRHAAIPEGVSLDDIKSAQALLRIR